MSLTVGIQISGERPMVVDGNIPGLGGARIQISDGHISSVQVVRGNDPAKPYMSPGFIDIQLNGFAGVDFSDARLEPQDILRVLPELWKTGLTTFCPTLVTNSNEGLLHGFRVLEEARRMDDHFARAVPCYHLEGPYISSGPSRGAHNPRFIRPPDWNEFVELQRTAGGRIGIVTLAPELRGAVEMIRRLRESGVIVALGHTDASPEQIHRAAEAGATLSTHLGNGAPPTIDRRHNLLWAQMAIDELTASIICDGFHVSRDLIRVISRAKGIDRCILVTDAIHVAGLNPGRYSLVGQPIELLPTGQVVMVESENLAGSTLTMNRAIQIFMEFSASPLQDALRAATLNPGRLLGRPGACLTLAEGETANLTTFRMSGDALEIETVLLKGELVYCAAQGGLSDARAEPHE
jgi:N-acetylglucosamine-6-phosphate deacetylase